MHDDLEDTTMPVGGSQPGHRDAPAEGPPSVRAQAALSDDLRREIADARARFEEAGLRAEAHRLLGDEAGASAVLREQDQILAEVQDRLGRAVSAAVIQRDAEQVLADVTRRDHAARAAIAAPDATRTAEDPTGPSVLAGVASLVAVLGVAAAAVLGLTRGLDEVAVDGVSADVVTEVATEGAAGPAPVPSRSLPAATTDDTSSGVGALLTPGLPTAPATPAGAPDATPPDQGPHHESPSPTPGPGLDTVVQDLIDAVAGLGTPDTPGAPSETDVSVPDSDEAVDQLAPDEASSPSPTRSDDGFVPAPSAE